MLPLPKILNTNIEEKDHSEYTRFVAHINRNVQNNVWNGQIANDALVAGNLQLGKSYVYKMQAPIGSMWGSVYGFYRMCTAASYVHRAAQHCFPNIQTYEASKTRGDLIVFEIGSATTSSVYNPLNRNGYQSGTAPSQAGRNWVRFIYYNPISTKVMQVYTYVAGDPQHIIYSF